MKDLMHKQNVVCAMRPAGAFRDRVLRAKFSSLRPEDITQSPPSILCYSSTYTNNLSCLIGSTGESNMIRFA
eukprot:7413-Amphidinium_carterae.1